MLANHIANQRRQPKDNPDLPMVGHVALITLMTSLTGATR
jgi:hypothetical protein